MSHFSLNQYILPLYRYYFGLNFDADPQNMYYNHAVRCHMLHFGGPVSIQEHLWYMWWT